MPTLTLTLSGPMAAYSTNPRLQHRLTQDKPTPSAVLGLIRCAMGIPRGENPEILNGVTVRVVGAQHADRLRDFHTIRDAVTYDGSSGRNAITTRHYLIEAQSVVEVKGPKAAIDAIAAALRHPHWQLYLGRRNCVPDLPLL